MVSKADTRAQAQHLMGAFVRSMASESERGEGWYGVHAQGR